MAVDEGKLLLVGSIARPEDGWTVEDVLRNSAEAVGPYVSMLPDGEIGDRSTWIQFISRRVFPDHPDLITTSRHTVDDWKARGYGDLWRVTVPEGIDSITIDKIGYADEAIESYETFKKLRDEGVIPEGVRFMVALPLTESSTRGFVGNARDFEILWDGMTGALANDIAAICAAIPHEDLAIQWDLARETAAVEGVEFEFSSSDLKVLPKDPMERYCHALTQLSPAIPEDVWLGLHVCYGSLEHKEGESPDGGHYVPIKNVGVGVDMINQGVKACKRSVEFVHTPIQFAKGLEDEHYEALKDLDIGDARVYLGLIESSDGVEGATARMEVAQRHLKDFGLATACGWGRRPLSQTVDSLLHLERDVADAVWGKTTS